MAVHPVVACYRGPDSVGALQLGAAFGTVLDQPLVLAVAYRYEAVALGASPLPSLADERRAEAAQAAVERARRHVHDVGDVREVVVPTQDVAAGLLDLARDCDASVVVLGRDVRGSVTADVVGHATCPVAVSPLDVALPDGPGLLRVAVADDGSALATLARRAARRIGERTGVEPDALTIPDGADAGDELTAASESYDLLVCGSHGRGRILSAVLGSVSSRLLRTAHCAVLVAGPGVDAAPATPLGVSTAART
jgi:nucleotide-binding universal stress UspA family protein